jgi:hypothetical protein
VSQSLSALATGDHLSGMSGHDSFVAGEVPGIESHDVRDADGSHEGGQSGVVSRETSDLMLHEQASPFIVDLYGLVMDDAKSLEEDDAPFCRFDALTVSSARGSGSRGDVPEFGDVLTGNR